MAQSGGGPTRRGRKAITSLGGTSVRSSAAGVTPGPPARGGTGPARLARAEERGKEDIVKRDHTGNGVPIRGLIALLALAALPLAAAEWPWSVEVPSVISGETQAPPRAFLWIPPACERVRAVVVGQHNMLEEPLLESPDFRAALAELGFAAVWVSPILCGQAAFGEAERKPFDEMLRLLAAESGYGELADAPVVPVGHSAMADFPYLYGAQCPERTLAAISLKGSWPDMKRPPLAGTGERLAGVPLLLVSGEYEWADERAGRSLAFRRAYPRVPFSMLADAGGGHFDTHEALAAFLGVYLRGAAQARLPAGAGPLAAVDPAKQGWLVDRWRADQPPRTAAAPVGTYAGAAGESFWCFDEAQARATEKMQAAYCGKKAQLLGFVQEGRVVGQDPKLHAQVRLAFRPEADGRTFKLAGTFLDAVPEGRPARWAGLAAGSPVGHAAGGGPVSVERICGPVEKRGPDAFAVSFCRMGMANLKRSNEIWLMATHPGDGATKRVVQQAVMTIPLRNEQGAEQRLTFPEIPDQKRGTQTVALRASSDAGVPVSYYVREGPAEVEGSALRLTRIPPRARFPVKVTVVAWQYGRSAEPRLRSAEPFERVFWVIN